MKVVINISLTEEERQLIDILNDPIKWSESTLKIVNKDTGVIEPFRARWYQSKVIRHIISGEPTSNRIVLRWGRRLGKCAPGYVEVLDPSTGELHTIDDLYNNQQVSVVTLNDDYGFTPTSNVKVMYNGVKEVFEITTSLGRQVQLTKNHPLLTIEGWKEVGELSPGDRIAVPKNLPYFGNEVMPSKHIKLLAYIIGDGGVTGRGVRFSNGSKLIISEMNDIASSLKLTLRKIAGDNVDYAITSGRRGRGHNEAIKILRKHDVFGRGSHNKRVPKAIFRAPKGQIAMFINRLFACDGWACVSRHITRGEQAEIGYCSVSKKLIYDIQHLLLRFGIMCNVSTKKVKYKGGHNNAYVLSITRQDSILRFADEINIFTKEDAVQSVVDYANNKSMNGNEETIPMGIWNHIEAKRKAKNMTKTEVATGQKAPCRNSDRKLRMQYAPSVNKVKRYALNMQDEDLYDLADSDIFWDAIKSINSIGEDKTYDLSVEDTHNFIANDIVVHNTSTFVIFAIWYCFTHQNAKILVAAPYDSQVSLIFKMIREFALASPELEQSIARDTKNPQYIEFRNGATISGFTSGTRSGAKGDSMRGQAADWIFLDEMDRLSSDDIDSITAVALENPDRIGIWAASTPTGKRDKFYQWCNAPKTWAHYHYPSTVNPGWGERSELEFRDILSEEGYQHEVLALWGEETIGVFKKQFIDRAKSHGEYDYLERATYPAIRVIGVDWDKYGAASQIVVVEFDANFTSKEGKREPKLRVINRSEISISEFTLDNAVKKIIELNEKFQPAFIYCDRGYGEAKDESNVSKVVYRCKKTA